ncbi:T9SS C-terminal target domain-containing protein [candidate division KSB1 bacterium]|nr:MAG: T9SS C-terminal target domain-containing protein [candidate division KSB1 bacterium]
MFRFRLNIAGLVWVLVVMSSLAVAAENTTTEYPPPRPSGPPPFCPEWIQGHFAELDLNQDGALNAEELATAADQAERPPRPDFFSRLDINGDGGIQSSELRAIEEERVARIQEFFRSMDKNSDGYLNLEEFQAAKPGSMRPPHRKSGLRKNGTDEKDRPLHRRIASPADRNMPPEPPDRFRGEQDSPLRPLPAGEKPTPAEIQAHFERRHQEMFERLDENEDGRLQLDELKHMPPAGPPPPPAGSSDFRGESDSIMDDGISLSTAGSAQTAQPVEFRLEQNYPNPFNATTTIEYDIPVSCPVVLTVYNLSGEAVKTLVNENQSANHYQVGLNLSDETSGQYFYRLQAGAFSDVRKMVYVK